MLERVFPSISLNRERTRRQIAEEIAARKGAEALTLAIAESIPAFAQDNDEGSWGSSTTGREPLDYTSNDLDQMWEAALDLSYRPGGRGLLDTMESFVIGDSMKVLAADEDPEVQEYWDSWAKLNIWDMKSKETFRRFLRDGEVFLRWFRPKGQRAEGEFQHLLMRFVEPPEIIDPGNRTSWGNHTYGIETDPDDVEKVLNYFRNYGRTAKDQIAPEDKWEKIPAAEIDHFKCLVDSNVKRGRSWLMGVGKYIRMHEQWLDQRFQLNRLRNLFAVIGNIKGIGGSDINTVKGKFADTTGKADTGGGTPKKMPSSAMMLLQKGIEWDLKSLNINAGDAAEDGRNFQLLIAVGTGLTEYVVRGDSSNSSYSSTMVSESPMVRMFQKYQDIMRYIQGVVFARVVRYGIESGQLSAMSTKTMEGQLRAAKRRYNSALREGRINLIEDVADDIAKLLKKKGKKDDDPGNDPSGGKNEPAKEPKPKKPPEPRKEPVPTSTECQVEFTPLIHRDIVAETNARAIHQDRKWASRQTCSSALGYDYEQEKKEIEKDDVEDTAKAKDADKENWS